MLKTNESAENYLETILVLSQKKPVVRGVDIAEELGFKKSSVSVAMKNLREKEQIRVTPEGESVSGIENKVVTGKVNADATALGSYALADDVQILDTTAEGVAGTVRPSRLSGVTLRPESSERPLLYAE